MLTFLPKEKLLGQSWMLLLTLPLSVEEAHMQRENTEGEVKVSFPRSVITAGLEKFTFLEIRCVWFYFKQRS